MEVNAWYAGIALAVLVVTVVIQEIRIQRLTERLLLQANIPQTLSPVPIKRGIEASEKVMQAPTEKRKKLFSMVVPD